MNREGMERDILKNMGRKLAATALAVLLCLPSPTAFAEQENAFSTADATSEQAEAALPDDDSEDVSVDAATQDGEEVIEPDAVPLASSATAQGAGSTGSTGDSPGPTGSSAGAGTVLAALAGSKEEEEEAAADAATGSAADESTDGEAATVNSDSDDYGDDTAAITFNVRSYVDGKWAYLSRDGTICASPDADGYTPITVTKQAYRADGYREIVPAGVLEDALCAVGFTAGECARADRDYADGSTDWGNYIFGYAPAGTTTVYSDVTPQLVDGTWYVFTMNAAWLSSAYGTQTLDLYYLPANRNDGAIATPSSFCGDSSRSTSDAQLVADNGFHSVNVVDDEGVIYESGELPATEYVNAVAGKGSVTVKSADDSAYWAVTGAEAELTDNGDGTTTIELSSITGPVTVEAQAIDKSKLTLTYAAAMEDSDRVAVGGIPAADQVIGSNVTIDGSASKTETVDIEACSSITLAAPDADSVALSWSRSSSGKTIYTFKGWSIGGAVYAAGEEVAVDVLAAAADKMGAVAAKSVWSAVDDGASPHIQTANFYLNLNCEILDVQGTAQQQSADKYTPSICATRVWGTDTFGSDSTFTLLAPAGTDSAAEVDSKIRRAAHGHGIFPPPSWTNYTDPDGVRLEALPSDEEVLSAVRSGSYAITIDGEAVETSTITADNFTVRWAAVKYDATDGWHIDGVLVAKKAKLTVSKTFEGEADALAAFATAHGYASLADFDEDEDFHVDVTHAETANGAETTATDYKLLLVADSGLDHSDSTDRRYGYTSYDAATNTYTWEIETRQYREYTVSEKNYYLSADDWNNLTWYEVRNSTNGSDTAGWTEYDAQTAVTVKVTAAAYPTDTAASAVQSVAFRNAYVHKGTLVVHKNDYATGQPMAGVAFAVSQTDAGATGALYRKRGSSEYTTDPSVYSGASGDYEKVDDGKAATDAQGAFYLSLAAPEESSSMTATYKLVEDKDTAPGYEGADEITFSMTYNEGIAEGNVETTGGAAGVEWACAGENRFILNIKNRSTEYTSVTAKMQWAEGSDAKNVTVQLWRKYGDVDEPVSAMAGATTLYDTDGNEVGNSAALSADNDWASSWAGLPLFIDNQQVTYHLRETWIGSEAYDAGADTDGYADFAVSYEAARYAVGDMPDVTASGDALRASYPLSSPVQAAADGTAEYARHALLVVDNDEVGREIALTKVDADSGAALAGAVFALYSDAAGADELERVTTGKDGLAAFAQRPVGTYYVKEVAAPAGYSFDRSAVYKAVVTTGRPEVTLVGDDEQAPVSHVANELGASLSVVKVGVNRDKRLAGAVFALEKAGGTGAWADARELTTGADGTLAFTGIRTGSYTLRETKAPAGYSLPEAGELAFTVSVDEATGTVKFDLADAAAVDGETFLSWDDISTEGNVAYSVTAANSPDGTLPDAGSAALAALGGAACTLAAAGLRARRRARG